MVMTHSARPSPAPAWHSFLGPDALLMLRPLAHALLHKILPSAVAATALQQQRLLSFINASPRNIKPFLLLNSTAADAWASCASINLLCAASLQTTAAASADRTQRTAARRARAAAARGNSEIAATPSLVAPAAAPTQQAPSRRRQRRRAAGAAPAAAAAAGMQEQKQQQQAEQPLLMSPEQQQRLLDAVKDRPPVIFYHYPCPDGVFAALAATLFFSARGVTPRYVPHEVYRETSIQGLGLQSDSVAFLLDYSGPDGFPQQLALHVSQVVVLDHHKTAAQQLADVSAHPANLAVCLDMQRSGAAIARDFFKPQGMSDTLQEVFRWVEDADLWRWALPDSQAFHAGLAATKLDYHAGRNPGIWQQLQELDVKAVLAKGAEALRYQQQLITAAVAASQPYQLGGALGRSSGWGRCLGCEVSGDLVLYRSRLGNSLATASKERGLAPVGLIAYTEAEQPDKEAQVKVSLRSTHGFDTSAVSGAFGGGGHAAASSCIVPRAELQRWRDMAQD